MNRVSSKKCFSLILLTLGFWPKLLLADVANGIIQEPQRPYPYHEEDVSINVGGAVKLAL